MPRRVDTKTKRKRKRSKARSAGALRALTRTLRRLGERLRTLRQAQRLTQEELAGRAQLDTKGLQAIEAGTTNVTMASLLALARALRVSLEEIFAGVYEPRSRQERSGPLT